MSKQVVPRDAKADTRREMLQHLKEMLASEGSETLREHIKRLAKAWGIRTPVLARAKAA